MASDSPTNSFFKSNNSYDGPIADVADDLDIGSGGTWDADAETAVEGAVNANATAINLILAVLREKGLIRS